MERNEKYWSGAKNSVYGELVFRKGGERNEVLNKYFTVWGRKHYLTTHSKVNFQYKQLHVNKNLIKDLRKNRRTLDLKNQNEHWFTKKSGQGRLKHKKAIHKMSNIHNDKHTQKCSHWIRSKCKLKQNTIIFGNQVGRPVRSDLVWAQTWGSGPLPHSQWEPAQHRLSGGWPAWWAPKALPIFLTVMFLGKEHGSKSCSHEDVSSLVSDSEKQETNHMSN